MDEKESWETSPFKYLPSSHVKTEMFTNPTLPSPSTKILFAHNWRSRRGGKIKYRGASVYLAPRTFNPLVYFFFFTLSIVLSSLIIEPLKRAYISLSNISFIRAPEVANPLWLERATVNACEGCDRTNASKRFVAALFAAAIQCLDVKFTILQSAPRYIIKSLYPISIPPPIPSPPFSYLTFLLRRHELRDYEFLELCHSRVHDLFIYFFVDSFRSPF